jgi:hypothetical protein
VARTIYALLVGIDKYEPPVPPLRGCVNDVEAFATYLNERVANSQGFALSLKTLKDEDAKREDVVKAFQDHFKDATKEDVALFYYSGHGSQEQAPEEFWALEPDHLDETLVLFDSRKPGSWDLADKEIAKLIGDLAAKGPHVAVILDCCHSGSGTRDVSTAVRRAPTDLRKRPIESFLVTPAEAQAAASTRGADAKAPSRYTPPDGRHVLFAACRDDQEAKEYVGDGQHRGAFSFFLNDSLKSAAGVPTYRDLFTRTSAGVYNVALNQSPQLEATRSDDLDATFLDGAIQPAPATFTARFHQGHWTINGGAATGIPAPSGSETTRLALYAFDAKAADLADLSKAVAKAKVESVQPASSVLSIEGGAALDQNTTYKAVILSLPAPPLLIRLEGDDAACGLVRQAIAAAAPEGGPSLFIREIKPQETPDFRLLARDGQYIIARPGDDRPLVGQIDGLNQPGAHRAVERLEHIARWTQTARLANPASSIKPDDVALTVLVGGQEVKGKEIRLEYGFENGAQVKPSFKVKITNNSTRPLYCGLLDLTQRFGVSAGLLTAGYVRLEPNQTVWANQDREIRASVPDEVWKQGIVEYRDLLKLIVCTQEFDPRRLEQPNLDMPRSKAVDRTRSLGRDGSLNRLMRKVQTRELETDDPPNLDDWQATEISFTTVRPQLSTPVPAAGQPEAALGQGVKLEPHPALRAQARLESAPLATRSLGSIQLPRLLVDDPAVSQPLTFTATRGVDPGLSVLELTEVSDPSVVTPDSPLRLTVPVTLKDDEHVLPVAYDGEFFLPLGRVDRRAADETVIALDRLPRPVVDSRSLTGAIRIFFQKVISKAVGEDFAYPVLAAADVATDGKITSTRDTAGVRDRVAKANKILLFVHGIIGETATMVPCVQLAKVDGVKPLESLYDLVLTFDYENLGTKIEDNGRLLKQKLAAVGLGPNHGKTLDIAAHSMGGLVSRWFIEREGGNQVVRRLVMLGTPNGGSPWPKVFDWATVALSLGLNQLTRVPWPAWAMGWLAKWVESPTTALNEMLAGAEVQVALNQSTDPGIPYTMIAGNTSLITAAVTPPAPDKPSLFARLIGRVTSPGFLHNVASPFFLGQQNDVAVSVSSMENVAQGRGKPLEVRPVACDHLTYFTDPEGLKALAEVLSGTV